MRSLHRSSSGESVLFLAWKSGDSKYSIGIPKQSHLLNVDTRQDVPHGLKCLSNDSISQDHFDCENFRKIYTLRPAKNH